MVTGNPFYLEADLVPLCHGIRLNIRTKTVAGGGREEGGGEGKGRRKGGRKKRLNEKKGK